MFQWGLLISAILLHQKYLLEFFYNALKLGEQNPAKPTEPKREGSYNSSRGVTTGKPMALPKFAESPLRYKMI